MSLQVFDPNAPTYNCHPLKIINRDGENILVDNRENIMLDGELSMLEAIRDSSNSKSPITETNRNYRD